MKKKILLITIIISFLFVPIARAETTGIISTEQLMGLFNRLIVLLMKQIEILQEQIALQQQSIQHLQSDLVDLTTTTSSTTTTTTTQPPATTTTTTTTTKPITTIITPPVNDAVPGCVGPFPCWW